MADTISPPRICRCSSRTCRRWKEWMAADTVTLLTMGLCSSPLGQECVCLSVDSVVPSRVGAGFFFCVGSDRAVLVDEQECLW
jgi:hypothetical protein